MLSTQITKSEDQLLSILVVLKSFLDLMSRDRGLIHTKLIKLEINKLHIKVNLKILISL